jgi:3-methylfumaryl-CoA hydratase
MHRQSLIGSDGHPMRGDFLPPVPLPRRMWAGSQLTFEAPLHVGQSVSRSSRISDVRLKQGRTGPLVFVQVEHTINAGAQLCIRETHDIVYRDMPAAADGPPAGQRASTQADWARDITADAVLLFRYSALTFNGHRIHYDRRYVTDVEAYPGLVVHGPLIATLLLDLLARELPTAQVRTFAFKAVKPIFDTAPFQLRGRTDGTDTVHLWAVTPDGDTAMQATAHIT